MYQKSRKLIQAFSRCGQSNVVAPFFAHPVYYLSWFIVVSGISTTSKGEGWISGFGVKPHPGPGVGAILEAIAKANQARTRQKR